MAVDQPDRSAETANVAVDQPEWPVAPFPQVKAYDEEKSMTTDRKALDPLREVRRILWTLLIAATVASIAGNVAHTVILHGLRWATLGPVVLALLGPVALLGLFHLMAAWARVQGAGLAIFWFYLLAIIGLAGAAFRLSFAALRDLALHYNYSRFDAALFPLILDGLIAVCTVGLVAATRPRRKAKSVRPTLPQRVRAWWQSAPADATQPVQSVHQPVQTPDAEQADAPAYPAGLTWLAPVHQPAVEQPVHQPAETAPEPTTQAGAPGSAPAVTSDDEMVHHPGAPVHRGPETQPVHTTERPRPVPVHQRTTEPEQPPVVQAVHRAQATEVVQAGASELPIETVAQVYACLDAGWSQTAIDRRRIANKRTVSKLAAARDELTDATAEEPEPEPAFA
ncbi:DUF2637 domain-containing protein [Nocardia farcinica]|uniref:DUF2637 domain-containing protein n=1 Tax=Nocardia farcinica TaxID=37329 RepID=UPI001893A8B0|nr:DUF2637 domain-containing protein [Nocardia farcinica]MBF6387103.1 DUF2637 domain-containing protein [Nocardia farcinica]